VCVWFHYCLYYRDLLVFLVHFILCFCLNPCTTEKSQTWKQTTNSSTLTPESQPSHLPLAVQTSQGIPIKIHPITPNPYIGNPASMSSVFYVNYFVASSISLLQMLYFPYSFSLRLFHYTSISQILLISFYSRCTETRYFYGCMDFLECFLTSSVYAC
jgi:hypothetical protein